MTTESVRDLLQGNTALNMEWAGYRARVLQGCFTAWMRTDARPYPWAYPGRTLIEPEPSDLQWTHLDDH